MYNYSLMVRSVYHTSFLHKVNVDSNFHAVHITCGLGGGNSQIWKIIQFKSTVVNTNLIYLRNITKKIL